MKAIREEVWLEENNPLRYLSCPPSVQKLESGKEILICDHTIKQHQI